jgi:ketosteroid isomerase-like protein
MSAQDNIQIVKNFYAAQKGGDQGAMLKCCAENVRVVLDTAAGGIPWSGEYEGHADLEAEQRLMAEFLQIDAFEQLDFLASETKVAVVSKIEVTVKKNGRKVSLPRFVHIMTFDAANKITHICQCYDPTDLVAALR